MRDVTLVVSVGCKYYKSAQETQTGLKEMIKAKVTIPLSFNLLHVIPNCMYCITVSQFTLS